jgi:hypothetical protein
MDFGVTVARAVCSVASIVVAGLAVPSAARAADLFQADSPVRGMVVPAPDAQEAADIAEFRLLLFLQERIHIVNVGQTSDSKFLVLWQEVPIDAPDPLLASFGSPRAPDSSGFAGGISVRGLSITGAITGTTDVDGGIPQGTARLRPQRAYRWTQSGGLVALPVPAGFDLSGGTAISATGSTVVGQISRAGDNQTALGAAQQAFRWTSALGTQSLGADTTAATGVNINGTVVVGNTSKTFSRAFRWDLSDPATGAGSLTALAPLAAAGAQAYSFAYGVSTSGQVVVGASQAATFDGPLLPVSWTGSAAPVSSGLAPGTTSGAALAVSGTGDVIVGLASTSAIDGSSEPDFRIQPDGLLTLANNSRTTNLTAARAIRWTQATGWQTLNDVAKANGIDTTGITFLTAETVTHDGQFIAGAAVFPTTVVIAWIQARGLHPAHLRRHDSGRLRGLQCPSAAATCVATGSGRIGPRLQLPGGDLPAVRGAEGCRLGPQWWHLLPVLRGHECLPGHLERQPVRPGAGRRRPGPPAGQLVGLVGRRRSRGVLTSALVQPWRRTARSSSVTACPAGTGAAGTAAGPGTR